MKKILHFLFLSLFDSIESTTQFIDKIKFNIKVAYYVIDDKPFVLINKLGKRRNKFIWISLETLDRVHEQSSNHYYPTNLKPDNNFYYFTDEYGKNFYKDGVTPTYSHYKKNFEGDIVYLQEINEKTGEVLSEGRLIPTKEHLDYTEGYNTSLLKDGDWYNKVSGFRGKFDNGKLVKNYNEPVRNYPTNYLQALGFSKRLENLKKCEWCN